MHIQHLEDVYWAPQLSMLLYTKSEYTKQYLIMVMNDMHSHLD